MDKKVKIVVTVPQSEADNLRSAIGRAGGGQIGEYRYCSFSVSGMGRFLPSDKANPAIGQPGKLEAVREERIEITCAESDAPTIVETIRNAHSYEEPAIDVYQLLTM